MKLRGSFTPWTLELSHGHVEFVIGCWLVLEWVQFTPRVTVEFEVWKRRALRPTLFTHMVQWVLQWERQKRCSERNCCSVFILNEFYLGEEKMKTREDKGEQKNGQTWKIFFVSQNWHFWQILKTRHILLQEKHDKKWLKPYDRIWLLISWQLCWTKVMTKTDFSHHMTRLIVILDMTWMRTV